MYLQTKEDGGVLLVVTYSMKKPLHLHGVVRMDCSSNASSAIRTRSLSTYTHKGSGIEQLDGAGFRRSIQMTNKIFDDGLHAKWQKFHHDNPLVYDLFKRFTFQAIQAGRKNYSVNAIFERIRWHTDIDTRGDEFKLNNNHRAYYGRKFMRDYPKFDGFFRTRDTKSA